jgi:hypothetical protein
MIEELYERFDNDEPAALAEKVLDILLAMRKADLRAELRPLVLNDVVNWQRNRARAIERAYARQRTGADPVDPCAAVKDLLATKFFSPLRGYVLWGEATVEDHLAYAQMQRKLADGLVQTAELHEDAARRITAAGVRCLFDLEAKEEAA